MKTQILLCEPPQPVLPPAALSASIEVIGGVVHLCFAHAGSNDFCIRMPHAYAADLSAALIAAALKAAGLEPSTARPEIDAPRPAGWKGCRGNCDQGRNCTCGVGQI